MEILDQYEIKFENSSIPVLIYGEKEDFVKTYEIGILESGKYTEEVQKDYEDDRVWR